MNAGAVLHARVSSKEQEQEGYPIPNSPASLIWVGTVGTSPH